MNLIAFSFTRHSMSKNYRDQFLIPIFEENGIYRNGNVYHENFMKLLKFTEKLKIGIIEMLFLACFYNRNQNIKE